MQLDWEALRARANEDREFRLGSRFWNATIRIQIEKYRYKIQVVDGELRSIEPWFGAIASDLSITAPERDWKKLLALEPLPFYQDLYPAAVHHDFDVSGDIEAYCAYYPAIRRLIEIMREVNNNG